MGANRSKKHTKKRQQQPTEISRAVPDIPPSDRNTTNPPKTPYDYFYYAKFFVEIATLGVIVIYTIFARQQVIEMRRSVEHLKLDERAWVGVADPIPPPYEGRFYVKEGKPLQLGVYIKNSGKTPAINVRQSLFMNFTSPNTFIPDFRHVKMVAGPSSSVLQPGASFSIHKHTPEIATKGHIESLKSGKQRAYLTIHITYDDIFGSHHTTNDCMYLDPNLSELHSYKTYSDAD